MTSVHNTDHAQVPQKSDIDNFVSMVGLDLLSNRSYLVWVQDKVALGEIWAIQMQVSFKLVTDFINYWCDYMEVISRRRNSGMSDFCKILPHSLPISKNQMNLKIYDCCITKQKQRPCFEIISTKILEQPIYVHHSNLNVFQTLWSISNINELINHSIQSFQNQNTDRTLNDICNSFSNHAERYKLIAYISFICDDVVLIFTKDNVFSV